MATPISKQIVDVFYLGGLTDDDGPQYVTSGGQAFVLPPRGESLRLELYKAEDLMRRYNIKGHIVFSLTKASAGVPLASERQYTREELLTMLSQLAAEPEANIEVTFDDEPDAHLTDVPPAEPVIEEEKQEEQSESAADVAKTETEPTPEPKPAPKGRGKTAKAAADTK